MSIIENGPDPRFPQQPPSGLPPSPTRENPGGVYPPTDPWKASKDSLAAPPYERSGSGSHPSTPARYVGNPFLMHEAFSRLDHSLGDVITMLQDEDGVGSGGRHNNLLLAKFRQWQEELDIIRTGKRTPSRSPSKYEHRPDEDDSQEGGMFTD